MSKHKDFWNKEYRNPKHLALSDNQSEDLEKWTRWLGRNAEQPVLTNRAKVLDLGCGNGRNLIYLAKEFAVKGHGYDISEEAISQAAKRARAENLPLTFEVRALTEPLPHADESIDVILDMMSSHFLIESEREAFRTEVLRVLKPGGWFFFKSFIAEGDLHVKRLLKENAADEQGAYIHPRLGVYEYVWTEQAIYDFFGPHFEIHKVEKSHKHISHGKAFKRRTVVVYLEKKF